MSPRAAKTPKEPKPPSEHQQYVKAALIGMWGRDTNLARLEGMHAARISKMVRNDELPLPDGTRPTPDDVTRIVAGIRGNGRPFTLGAVLGHWQRVVDEEAFGRIAPSIPTVRAKGTPALRAEDLS